MKPFDRRSEIVRYLQSQRRASTRALSERFDVSEVTIRHDLTKLEEQGWLTRVHGGAEIAPRLQREQPFVIRQQMHAAEKEEIAQAAAATILPGETIILDGSTSAYHLALQLHNIPDLRIVTNNLYAVSALASKKDAEVVLIGGVVRTETATVVGGPAEDMLAGLYADKGVFSAAGLTPERGLTDADIREVQVKRVMIDAVAQVNVLLDASKFGQQAFLTYASLSDIDFLFTDEKVPAEYGELFREHNIQLVLADGADE